jgi:hypothetical protein
VLVGPPVGRSPWTSPDPHYRFDLLQTRRRRHHLRLPPHERHQDAELHVTGRQPWPSTKPADRQILDLIHFSSDANHHEVICAQTKRPCPCHIWTLATGEVTIQSLPSTIKPPGVPQWKPRPYKLSQNIFRSLYLSLFTPRYRRWTSESIYRADYSDRPNLLEVYREKPLVFIIILARLIEPEWTQSLASSRSLSPDIAGIHRELTSGHRGLNQSCHLIPGEISQLLIPLLHPIPSSSVKAELGRSSPPR